MVAVDAVDSDEGVVWGEACHIVGYFFLCFAGAVCVVGGVGDSELAVGFVGVWLLMWVRVRVCVVVVVVWMLLMVVLMVKMRRWWRRGRSESVV